MRLHHRKHTSRPGAVLVLLVISLVVLMTFLALAIDLGLLAIARTQCQDAADAAAMAGTRTLNGNTAANNNYSNASPNATTAATNNTVLSKTLTSSDVNVQVGRYVYVSGNQRFEGQFPGPSTENWSMVKATVSANVASALAFSKVLNFGGTTLSATATAAHRPRDVAIVLDYSGSMRYASLVGIPTSGDRSSNNADTNVPTWGHYSSGAGLTASSFTSPFDDVNLTANSTDGRAPMIGDFYTNTSGSAAFSSASNSYSTTPGGDRFMKKNKNTSSNWCTTAYDLLFTGGGSAGTGTRDATFESSGYTAYGMQSSWNGYTQGPNYWGKTFFLWPPDPVATRDWRRLYFDYPGTNTGMDDNSKLWDSSGNWRQPGSSTYEVDYDAILNFIKNVGPNPFPSRLQSGRILYYDSIPSTISTGTWPPTDMNQRFWKDYIDYVLGQVQTGSSSYLTVADGDTGYTGYGADFTFGSVQITAKSALTGSPKPYMHYGDNPKRPRTHFWFGPLSMIDFLGNYNIWTRVSPDYSRFCWLPGTCHEAPLYACKLGIRAALTDINNNHPNDLVSVIMFSTPRESSSDADGRFNRARVGLSRDYTSMQESLWYPPATVGNSSSTVRPYDSNNIEVPRAMGGTCYSMGLMLAYNQFSANSSLVNYNPGAAAGDAGGNGRKGAQKIVIFETDGAPNATASASFNNLGSHNSYYSVRYNSSSPGSSEFPNNVNSTSDNSSTVVTQITGLCTQICALDTASPPGYSSSTKKALIHCIGFGPEFSSSANSADNIATLNSMQTAGNVTDGMPGYKLVYGSESVVASELQQAFTQILQSGVQVSLIQ
jgi:Flp pilus assembly protein TadG